VGYVVEGTAVFRVAGRADGLGDHPVPLEMENRGE